MDWLPLFSIMMNALAAVIIPILGKKLADRAGQVAQARASLDTVADGLRTVEAAVEGVRDPDGSSAVTDRIRTYGREAIVAVDAARALAHNLELSATEAREQAIIQREREEHEAAVAARTAPPSSS